MHVVLVEFRHSVCLRPCCFDHMNVEMLVYDSDSERVRELSLFARLVAISLLFLIALEFDQNDQVTIEFGQEL